MDSISYKFVYRNIEVVITATSDGISLIDMVEHSRRQIDMIFRKMPEAVNPAYDPGDVAIAMHELPRRLPAVLRANSILFHRDLNIQAPPSQQWLKFGKRSETALVDYMLKHGIPILFPYKKKS